MTFRFLFQADIFRILHDPDDFNVRWRAGVGPEFFSNRVAVAEEIARHRLVDDPDAAALEVVVFVKIAAGHNRHPHRREVVWRDDVGVGSHVFAFARLIAFDVDVDFVPATGKNDPRRERGRTNARQRPRSSQKFIVKRPDSFRRVTVERGIERR